MLVTAWAYGSGRWAFTETHVNEFLSQWEEAAAQGDADAICDTLADDLTFTLNDRSAGTPLEAEGGKEDLCAYFQKVIPIMAKVASSSEVRRDDLVIKRDTWHWWTADVSYTEYRSMRIAASMTLKTIGEDRMTLVKTLKGLRVKRLESQSWIDDGS